MAGEGHRIYTLNLKEPARLSSETRTVISFLQTVYEESTPVVIF